MKIFTFFNVKIVYGENLFYTVRQKFSFCQSYFVPILTVNTKKPIHSSATTDAESEFGF